MKTRPKIGIYAGTFDPVHAGHITFAIQSLSAAGLNKVYFLPERRPRQKKGVEHFAHRVAMLKSALKPYPEFEVMEMVDISFSSEYTLPRLKSQLPDVELVYLFGSDVVKGMDQWPGVAGLLKNTELVIGLRFQDDRDAIHKTIEGWKTQPKAVTVINSFAPKVSSGKVRQALRQHETAEGMLKSVERYSNRHWLYVSLS